MTTHSLPTGATRAPAAGKRPGATRRLLDASWQALKVIGASRGRRELLALARDQQQIRPELAARLRELARSDWL